MVENVAANPGGNGHDVMTVAQRKADREKERQKRKDKHGDGFQQVSVPNKDGVFEAAYRCRKCGDVVRDEDPSKHKCEPKVQRPTSSVEGQTSEDSAEPGT